MSKVSVIIPTYKRSEAVMTAVQSVLTQTYQDIEVIVVDDNLAESDHRSRTSALFADHLADRVKYLMNPRNMGGALARNVGIEHAVGQFITFLDDDDVYKPDKVGIQVKAMEENHWDLCFMDAEMRTPDGQLLVKRSHTLPMTPTPQALLYAHLVEHITPTASYMFRAEKLRAIGGFDNSDTGHEFLLMLKAIENNLRIGYVPQSELIQYVHEGERISTGAKKVSGENTLYAVKRHYFPRLTAGQRRSIAVRHWATLAFVYYKQRNVIRALTCGTRAFLTSPPAAVKLLSRMGGMIRS